MPTNESKEHPDPRMDPASDRTGGQVDLSSTDELPGEGVERKLNRPQKILRDLSEELLNTRPPDSAFWLCVLRDRGEGLR